MLLCIQTYARTWTRSCIYVLLPIQNGRKSRQGQTHFLLNANETWFFSRKKVQKNQLHSMRKKKREKERKKGEVAEMKKSFPIDLD